MCAEHAGLPCSKLSPRRAQRGCAHFHRLPFIRVNALATQKAHLYLEPFLRPAENRGGPCLAVTYWIVTTFFKAGVLTN